MSIEHMRTLNTLQRNVVMTFLVEKGVSIHEVARMQKLTTSAARSSVERTRGHMKRFVQRFPDVVRGQDPRRAAIKAFAEHVGVRVVLRDPDVRQAELF